MKTLRTIWIIAWFEILILFRSWFFRIFSGLILLFLFGINIGMLQDGGGNWAVKAIPANIPYFNMLILSLSQAFIAMFLALDFLKRDKKLDTSEVIYTRSMTNWAYVWGKTIGVLIVFIVLNLLALLLALIINMAVSGIPVDLAAYFYYPLIISLPSLIFILGFSFVIMSLVKNQAIALVILLGYTGLVMFYGKDHFDYVFDYIGFRLPLIHSDQIGFGYEGKLLLQRMIYLLFGLSFISGSILLLKRLPQSRFLSLMAWVMMITCGAAGAGALAVYAGKTSNDNKVRKEMITLNDQNNNLLVLSNESTDLSIRHHGSQLSITAKETLINRNQTAVSKTAFSLNPGFELEKLLINGTDTKFERERHLVIFNLPASLSQGEKVNAEFVYKGAIDERSCYLDIKKEQAEEKWGPDFIIAIRKRFAILEPDYVLLTPESSWYPQPGVLHGTTLSVLPSWNFTKFTATVETKEGLQPIMQGPVERSGNQWVFRPENQLPGMTLIIGPYEDRSLEAGNIRYELSIFKGHDYFSSTLDSIQDTLPRIVSEMMQDVERRLGLKYSFPRLKLVEVPVQFYSYYRLWIKNRDFLQPEMVFLPERGSMLSRAGFSQEYKQTEKRSKQNEESLSEKEIQLRVLRNFLSDNFNPGTSGGDFRFGMEPNRNNSTSSDKKFSLFPQYYTFINHIGSSKYPILNTGLEAYITNSSDQGFGGMGQGTGSGLSAAEQANVELQRKTFAQLLGSEMDNLALRQVIDAKGKYFFTYLEAVAGSENFMPFLLSELEKYRYRTLDLDSLTVDFRNRFGMSPDSLAERWYHAKALPGYLVGKVRVVEVQQEDRTRYQLLFDISNPSQEGGLIQISLRAGRGGMGGRGGGGGMRGGPTFALAGRNTGTEKFLILPANAAFKVGYVLDDQPRAMSINTMISNNLPNNIGYPFPQLEQIRGFEPIEGLKPVEVFNTISNTGEIIVDNEETGFSTSGQATESRLVKWLKINKTDESVPYKALSFRPPPQFWTPVIQSGFYGDLIRSAVYVKSGDGNLTAEWRTVITKPGYYEVYTYLNPNIARMGSFRGGGGQNSRQGGPGMMGGPGSMPEITDEYHYTVFHAEGSEDITLSLKTAETGWNLLGSFYYEADTARVMINDKNGGKTVVADAIKWIKQQ